MTTERLKLFGRRMKVIEENILNSRRAVEFSNQVFLQTRRIA